MARKPQAHQYPGYYLRSGTCAVDMPYEMSRWEKFLLAENLDENNLTRNPKVRDFVIKHARSYFVPVKVLRMYGMDFED